MADLFGGVGQILQLALKIKEAADTVRQNREDCHEIGRRVSRLHGILSSAARGKGKETVENSEVRAALGDLVRILGSALDLVTTCQGKGAIFHCFTAGKLSRQLAQVKHDITDQLAIINLAIQFTLPRPEDPPVFRTPSVIHVPWDFWEREVHNDDDPHTPPHGFDTIHLVMEMTAATSSCFRVFSFSELEVATNKFSVQQVIHEGDRVTVHKGVLPDGSMVAIKRSHDEKDLLFPVHLEHKNIVTTLGHCRYEQGELVVEEYMPNGTLSEMLNVAERSQQLGWPFTLQTVRGIAEGVAYLQTMRVVHPDLKASNIFFDSDMNPKIGGFGRSKLVLEQGVAQIKTEELLGTVGNIPPEYISDGIISMKSNVFSFGVLFLRIISGMRGPVLEKHPIAWALEVWEARQMEPSVSLRDQSEPKEMERCIVIGLLCTQMDPRNRPTMPDVLEMLNSQEELPTPELSCFLGIRSAEQEQPWWRSSWWKRRSDGRNWSLLEKTR